MGSQGRHTPTCVAMGVQWGPTWSSKLAYKTSQTVVPAKFDQVHQTCDVKYLSSAESEDDTQDKKKYESTADVSAVRPQTTCRRTWPCWTWPERRSPPVWDPVLGEPGRRRRFNCQFVHNVGWHPWASAGVFVLEAGKLKFASTWWLDSCGLPEFISLWTFLCMKDRRKILKSCWEELGQKAV